MPSPRPGSSGGAAEQTSEGLDTFCATGPGVSMKRTGRSTSVSHCNSSSGTLTTQAIRPRSSRSRREDVDKLVNAASEWQARLQEGKK